MKLHHVPGSRSSRVRWLLEELGVDCQIEGYKLGDPALKSSTYLAKNPLGRVPTFEDGDTVFYESGAIVQYLLERFGDGRLEPPVGGESRALYLQWFHFAEATLMPPMGVIMGNRFVLREEDRSQKALRIARIQLGKALGVIGSALDDAEYLVDDRFSAADIMTGYSATLLKSVGELPDEPKSVHAWLARLAQRPAYQVAFAGGFGG
ncbi:MAG: glutathione S-transferase [Deltaproteobacteria bacterium]|nr:glutathione S-transferase [Deltaproteobacteria bacterium]